MPPLSTLPIRPALHSHCSPFASSSLALFPPLTSSPTYIVIPSEARNLLSLAPATF